MKKILSLILVMIAFSLPSMAEETDANSSLKLLNLEVRRKNNHPSKVHRAPMRIPTEAYYDEESRTINICYNGDTDGEVYLYLNENMVGYDSEINTSFPISSSGLYRIEIITESWIAHGEIQL